ncbi:MAG: ROK family protein [Anaerolineales bacterium]|nr:ROK family protein [Anaerolineales bacterium]
MSAVRSLSFTTLFSSMRGTAMTQKLLGVDLGGTQIRATLANSDGVMQSRVATLTLADEGPTAVIERIVTQIEAARGDQHIAAIGLGAPGPIDPYNGVVIVAPNLPGWHNIELRQILSRRFGVPVYIGNDANLAGLAEFRFGAGRGSNHMIYITVSTGIGGGVIINRRLLLGSRGMAAEIGHVTIDLTGELEGRCEIGTLEGLASGPNLAKRARRALANGAKSAVLEWVHGDIEAVSPRLLQEAAEQGDEFALDQYALTGRYLGVGITNLLHTFNPQRIVIGGSVWLYAGRYIEATMWETIRQRAQSPDFWNQLEIVSAALGDDVGLLGAVALAADELERAHG